MKEQRQALNAAAAVEANLGEIEGPKSRFIDAGFVSTGGRDVDWAGKFLNAAKAGIAAYHSTDTYNDALRTHKTQALQEANNYVTGTLKRAEEQEVTAEGMPYFLMQETNTSVEVLSQITEGREDDSLSRAYKDTFQNQLNSRYNRLTVAAQAKNNKEQRDTRQDQMETFYREDDSFNKDDLDANTSTLFHPREQAASWSKAIGAAITSKAAELEVKTSEYNLLAVDEAGEMLTEIKNSGMTKKEWLASKSGEGETLTQAQLLVKRMEAKGIDNPLKAFEARVQEALSQQGSDGVGTIIELNNSTSIGLLKEVKAAVSKVKGIKFRSIINSNMVAGVSDIETDLNKYKTGSVSEDARLKESITQDYTILGSTLFQSTVNPLLPGGARDQAGGLLQQLLMKNPDQEAKIMSTISNEFAANWQTAIDSTDPKVAISFLQQTADTLWSTEVGSYTRKKLLEAVGPDFELVMNAHRAGVNPEHLIEFARGNIPEMTKEELAAKLGYESHTASVLDYEAKARAAAPWAGPKEINSMVSFAQNFDANGLGYDQESFFSSYGADMSFVATAPKDYMEAGEDKVSGRLTGTPIVGWIADIWGGNTLIPKTGAWKEIITLEGRVGKGAAQASVNYMLANASPELTQRLVDKLGMEVITKSYSKDGKTGSYKTLDWGEGFTDDARPIKVTRAGDNTWKISVTTEEWTDNVWLIGSDQQFVTFHIDNADVSMMGKKFEEHIGSLEDNVTAESIKKQTEQEAETAARVEAKAKKKADTKPIPTIYEGVGIDGFGSSLVDWWDSL